MVKHQLLWYAISISIYSWFMFWIAYDIFVWQKTIFEWNIGNFLGALASIAFIWAEVQLCKNKQSTPSIDVAKPQHLPQPLQQPKLRKPYAKRTEPQKPNQLEQAKLRQKPAQPPPTQILTSPMPVQEIRETHTNYANCIHYAGHLAAHQDASLMPNECLTCTNLIQCLTSKKPTTTQTNQTPPTTEKPTNKPKTKQTKKPANQKPKNPRKNKKTTAQRQTPTHKPTTQENLNITFKKQTS